MQTNIQYFWVKFYPAAEWQLVKFWTSNEKSYLKGLDWGSVCEVNKFDNKNYTIGPEVYPPTPQ